MSPLKNACRLLGIVLLGLAQASAIEERPAQLPDAQRTVVLELSFVDDPHTPQERTSVSVRVLADGSVLVPSANGDLQLADRLPPQDLAKLMDETVVRGRLNRCDSQRLQSGIAAACRLAGLSPDIAGAATTVIRFHDGRSTQEVRCPALSVAAARFPDFPEVQSFFNAQLRLQNVAVVARVGGEQASRQLAEVANRSLKQSHPELTPLTVQELSMMRELTSGTRYIQFYRRQGGPQGEILVSLFESPGQPPRVDVLTTPPAAQPQ